MYRSHSLQAVTFAVDNYLGTRKNQFSANRMHMLTESTAAALTYIQEFKQLPDGANQLIAVLDVGCGTTDVSIIHLRKVMKTIKVSPRMTHDP